MAPSQYKTPPQLPPKFTATKESLIADTKRLIERSRGVQDGVVRDVKSGEARFANVVLPIARDDNQMVSLARTWEMQDKMGREDG